jgi:RHS repeat-associated protein
VTYPSGHTVNYIHDQAGRLSGLSGNLGGSPSTYADTIGYNAAGQMIKERFGTNTSLYHNSFYNNRMQLVQIRLGDSATDDWNPSRGAIGFLYGTNAVANGDVFANDTDNNGNLRWQNHYVPLAGGGYVVSQQHDYTYDALNRIATIREQQRNESGQWAESVSQAYLYDRWGNRTLDLSGGGSGAVVWVDDALPAGATAVSDGGDGWTWVSSNPIPYSGTVSHQSAIAAGLHQHYFYGATQTLQVNAGDRLYAYVYLDPANPPSTVMLQWNDGTWWDHRAYWGANNLPWGVDGTESKRYMGPLPAAGGWVRLEVPASAVGLEGMTVNGMAFSLYDGRATWDKAGKVGLFYGAGPPINNNVYTVDAGRNRLTLVNGAAMSYDAAGNQTNDGSGQRTYDAENRMLTATNGGVSSSYTYDADGQRVRRIIGGVETWQIYGIGGELLAEYQLVSGTPTLKKEYGYRNGQLLVVWDADEPLADKKLKWLVTDHLGSTRMEADKSGSLAGMTRRDYAPFGEELGAGVGIRSAALGYGADSTRQKFGSKERDIETGLDFFEARYFSSVQGRFTSPDPTLLSLRGTNPQTLNRYSYVLNNPLRYIDPFGLWEYDIEYHRNKKNQIDRATIILKKSKEGDNAATLAKQLGFDPNSKDGQKLQAKIEKQLGNGDSLQGTKLGGIIGQVFQGAEHGLAAQKRFNEEHPSADPTAGPPDPQYNDCSMTTCRIAFPGEMAGKDQFSVFLADEMIRGLKSVSQDALRTGDIVRYADSQNTPQHFMTVFFTGDDGVTQAFSRSGVNGRFQIVPTDAFSGGNYGTIKGIGKKDSGFYRPPQ